MKRRRNYLGQTFGQLTVVGDGEKLHGREVSWRCQCTCGNVTDVFGYALTSGKTVSCGCAHRAYLDAYMAKCDAERADIFNSHVDRSGGPDACWPWTAKCNEDGYGVTTIGGGRTSGSHRVALLAVSPPPFPGAWALHNCDNRPCCNPAHLYWGTARDNAADRSARNTTWLANRTGTKATRFVDLSGRRFGLLTVVRFHGARGTGATFWECLCDCGAPKLARTSYLKNGDTKSCGCLGPQVARARMLSGANPARSRGAVLP